MESIVTTNSAVSAEEEEILGKAAAEYVKLNAQITELKNKIKGLDARANELKTIFKARRTGETNEIIRVKYNKVNYSICFKDNIRHIIDQAAVRAEYSILGKTVPMKESPVTSLEVLRA